MGDQDRRRPDAGGAGGQRWSNPDDGPFAGQSPPLTWGRGWLRTFDQRGEARTQDDPGVANAPSSDGTDIGAFEAEVSCILTCPDDISVSNDTVQRVRGS